MQTQTQLIDWKQWHTAIVNRMSRILTQWGKADTLEYGWLRKAGTRQVNTSEIMSGGGDRCGIDRKPVAVKEPFRETERCCFCGKENFDGIYTRHDPNELKCVGKGVHTT